MTAEPIVNNFFREYDLTKERRLSSSRIPAAHQRSALERLHYWFSKNSAPEKGGILVLPTGAGKTFTAMRFLCAGPLSQGYKVLWLAHTHHLLEQAMESLEREVGQVAEPKSSLTTRVVSGTIGHCRVHEIKPSDDVLICTLQTITQASRLHHPQLNDFLNAGSDKLCVVFDEAHHSPAYSYRALIGSLREQNPKMLLLGLTATPTYTDEKKRGWLKKLFPQEIVFQTTAQELMAAGILAKPIFEDHRTDFGVEFDEREFQKWRGTYRDLPEEIITQLAQSRERNQFIADTYAQQRERYGKTIIFADRWFQCEQIGEFLGQRGVRTGAVYTHVDADLGGVAARRRRTADENRQALEAFRRDELDVLINVRMLTEGTDVPEVRSVFLTRQTTSGILLTQMIGRALRGPKFGGTAEAHIVSFFDNWKHLINWADYQQLSEGLADEDTPEYAKRPPLQYVSIDLVQRLSRQMDTGQNITTGPFLSLLPVGWYRVEFEARVAGSDDRETIRHLVMVFENEQETYRQFIGLLRELDLAAFEPPEANFSQQIEELTAWRQKFFANFDGRSESDLLNNIFHIARHVAQNQAAPDFFLFDERERHDLDRVARQFIEADLGPRSKNQALEAEYSRLDSYWNVIYPNYLLFKSQYDACENRCMLGDVTLQQAPSPSHPELRVEREPSEELKEQVKARDGYRCLCCGETIRRSLQIDHVSPAYLGVLNSLENLQTLCRVCNGHKGGINEINFRSNRTLLALPPQSFTEFDLPPKRYAGEPEEWEKFLQRSINFFYRCAAVEYVKIGRRGVNFYHWQIYLYAHNNPQWLESHLPKLLQKIRGRRTEVGKLGPDKITVAAPDSSSVSYPL